MRYFDHDTSASDDDKIMALRLECGGAAVDAYWAVLELIYRDETELVVSENQPKTKSLCHRLCVGFEQLRTWLQAMVLVGLLTAENGAENCGDDAVSYGSPRASENIERYAERKETARQNGRKGGRKPKQNRTETKSVSKKNREESKPETKEKEKLLVTHKGLPNSCASDGAAAAKAAPASARCPRDGAKLWRNTQTGRLHCPECMETFDPGGVL